MHKNNNRFARNCQRHPQLSRSHPLPLRLKLLGWMIAVLFAPSLFAPSLFMQSLYAHETIDNTNATANTATKVETREETTAATSQPVTLPSVASQYGVSRKTLIAAEATDANPQGVSDAAKANAKTLSKDKGSNNLPIDVKLNEIKVRAKRFHEIGPLPGLGLTKDEIPGNVQSITAKEIKESHSLSITDLMNKKLQSVTVNDYQGNPFMMDVQYRGFTAGPQIGTPQGLSVFFDGIRVNEPFGDVVNWDLIPMNALAGVDVFPGSNPIFGLGTLGGAFTVKTKDGFNNDGVDAEILTGSYGRKQLQVSGGTNNGTFALFGAGNFFLEDGWRDNSPSKVNQFFGKASYRGEKLDLNLSTLLVGTDLVGNGLLPSEMYKQDPSSVFSSPDTTKNKLIQFQLSGAFQVNDNFNITGQVYNRNSKRHSVGSDVYTEFSDGDNVFAPKKISSGDQLTCLYESTTNGQNRNLYGIPDYYLVTLPAVDSSGIANEFVYADAVRDLPTTSPDDPLYADYVALVNEYNSNPQVKFIVDAQLNGSFDMSLIQNSLNQKLPEYYGNYVQERFNFFKNYYVSVASVPQAEQDRINNFSPDPIPNGDAEYGYLGSRFLGPGLGELGPLATTSGEYYYTLNDDGTYSKSLLLTKRALNLEKCTEARTRTDANGNTVYQAQPGSSPGYLDFEPATVDNPTTGGFKVVDGAFDAYGAGTVIEGVPTAVITENDIDQLVKGGAVQLNWNLEHHKFMVGISIDSASADYNTTQRLGFLDAKRDAYFDPQQALDAYIAANEGGEIRNNDFEGTSLTKSIYASETWSPIETVHLTGALRYNQTKVKNTLAVRESASLFDTPLHAYPAYPDDVGICPNRNCNGVPTGYRKPDLSHLLNKPKTEQYSYYSLNPSLGATWQATPNLNIFGNVAQGTRTPSVIELGCALGRRKNPDGTESVYGPGRTCSLPSALSGDPYLPQIKATTYDIGLRGTVNKALGLDNVEWNLGAYRTDLRDDIYLVSLGPGRDFSDTIGDTRRQGIEAGFGGALGKARFKLNYALTDATFEETFKMASADNSSGVQAIIGDDVGYIITVKDGSRMPGVSLHNLNANVSYDLTDKWTVGLTAVAHSESFLRGNENNEHKKGVAREVHYSITDPATGISQNFTTTRQPTNNPGKVPGYATFNFQTSYKFNNEWTASMLVTNLFDKEYFSAGRLGRNPFSPVIQGQRDISGYNHNSNDWLSTNFIAPSAPRGLWFSLNWQFDPKK